LWVGKSRDEKQSCVSTQFRLQTELILVSPVLFDVCLLVLHHTQLRHLITFFMEVTLGRFANSLSTLSQVAIFSSCVAAA